ncbi:hypothetical protein PV371_31110 [Streptomyces sp. TX20-6-3]|uniref:hypothetical protein n=1 Tax=Streptomyces sp. TX20-6-3 TaxID=3028705 RepID=UPI0029A79614|nr:hypothetical protein [Streptomyces sp. TX20-6-3]MDX2564077.1 hypothetical protein [Streptomyces sp. TX20-6-3]
MPHTPHAPHGEPHSGVPTGAGGAPHALPRAEQPAEGHEAPVPPPYEEPSALPSAGDVARSALPGRAERDPDLDTVALGGGRRFVVTAATWLRPDGYVEWDGGLCRAHWQGPASAYPRPGDLVRVTVTPDSEPPLLRARPLD